MVAGTNLPLVLVFLLVLSDSGARTRHRRSCAAETPSLPAPAHLRRSTLRVDSVWHVHDSDSRATTGKRPLCVLQGRLLSSVSSASSCSSLPTRYRPMEYGDSSPFSCSARRLASCTTSTWERNGRSLCSPSSPRKAFGVREPNGSARIRQRRL